MRLIISVVLALGLATLSHAETISIAEPNHWDLSQWDYKSFEGDSRYSLVANTEGEQILKAETDGSASGYFHDVEIDLNKTPLLSWRWKVDNVHDINNQQVKKGDDFPARIYVVAKYGSFPWQAVALNYVWSNIAVEQKNWENPFTDKAMMIAVSEGKENLGQWQSYTVNIKEDLQRYFGKDLNQIDVVAIMADSDNHGGKATSYFSEIRFSD